MFQQVYTMVDTMEMDYFIGDDAISAIGATSALYSLMVSFAISMNNGYEIVVARSFPARGTSQRRGPCSPGS